MNQIKKAIEALKKVKNEPEPTATPDTHKKLIRISHEIFELLEIDDDIYVRQEKDNHCTSKTPTKNKYIPAIILSTNTLEKNIEFELQDTDKTECCHKWNCIRDSGKPLFAISSNFYNDRSLYAPFIAKEPTFKINE